MHHVWTDELISIDVVPTVLPLYSLAGQDVCCSSSSISGAFDLEMYAIFRAKVL